MRQAIKQLLPAPVWHSIRRRIGLRNWEQRQFAAPSPGFVKELVLLRNSASDNIWVETGTYRGDTTHFLSRHAKRVYSIEPEPDLFKTARARFAANRQVEIINGLSEAVLGSLLPKLTGDVSFWLDAHFSSGPTHRGPQDTPIAEELRQIEEHLNRWDRVSILIDDVRHFDPRLPDLAAYPPLDYLVDWARKNKLEWHIEHDIFVARKPGPQGGCFRTRSLQCEADLANSRYKSRS